MKKSKKFYYEIIEPGEGTNPPKALARVYKYKRLYISILAAAIMSLMNVLNFMAQNH